MARLLNAQPLLRCTLPISTFVVTVNCTSFEQRRRPASDLGDAASQGAIVQGALPVSTLGVTDIEASTTVHTIRSSAADAFARRDAAETDTATDASSTDDAVDGSVAADAGPTSNPREGGPRLDPGDVGPSPPPRVDVSFVDVTLAAGIDHVQAVNFACGSPEASGECDGESSRMTGGAAAGDYDGDGWMDLYVTRYDGPDRLYRNSGDGTFEDVTDSAGLAISVASNGAAFGDVDNDGDQDLYVTAHGDVRHYLFINDGTGVFTEQGESRGATLLPVDLHLGTSVAFGDFDVDGFADIYIAEWRPNRLFSSAPAAYARLLQNQGTAAPGYFVDVTEAAGVALDTVNSGGVFAFAGSFTDFDGDGFPDLAIASDFGSSRLFWNNRDGTFTDGTVQAGVGTDENGMGSAIGDYDGDGLLDWFVTSIYDPAGTCETETCNWGYSGNRLYRNKGDRTFDDDTDTAGVRDGAWGWGTTFFDYDNDGDLDLVMTNGMDLDQTAVDEPFNATPMRLWRNDGDRFTEVAAASGLTDADNGRGLLIFDYDRDGDLDIFTANNGASPRLYRNDGGNARSWLRVQLEGTRSTRDAFGAKLWLRTTPDAPVQFREHRGGTNFLGQNESIVHFGLGDVTTPLFELRVRWPSGNEQALTDIDVNQTLALLEPSNGG